MQHLARFYEEKTGKTMRKPLSYVLVSNRQITKKTNTNAVNS